MPVTVLDAGIAIPRLPRPKKGQGADRTQVLSNDCHSPEDGRFCETTRIKIEDLKPGQVVRQTAKHPWKVVDAVLDMTRIEWEGKDRESLEEEGYTPDDIELMMEERMIYISYKDRTLSPHLPAGYRFEVKPSNDGDGLAEFANPCHDPDDGRFCETHGKSGTGTALLERKKRSKKVEPATKAKHSNDIEAVLSSIPADEFEGQEYVDALQTPQFSITTFSKGEDLLLKQVRHAQGFDVLPQVVDQATFDKIPGQAFYRGVGGPRNSNYSEQYRTGDHFAGRGVFANGDYFTTSAITAKGYAEGYPVPGTIQAKLRPGARIISFEDISDVHEQARETHVWPLRDNPATATRLLKVHRQYDDLGTFAAAAGYDAIRVESPKIGNERYFVILNRGAVVVSEEDLP